MKELVDMKVFETTDKELAEYVKRGIWYEFNPSGKVYLYDVNGDGYYWWVIATGTKAGTERMKWFCKGIHRMYKFIKQRKDN